ncbi:MAG: UDP-N-acetylmuramate--L-alanine ligase [Spirochaetales bacterium]|nr:UDP-N-acetylmuramate--L-alanine ligase [Spirochaetales bacterium]
MDKNNRNRKVGKVLFDPQASIYLVGIKGTGMTALAEILHSRGISITGSDVEEEFYTDSILKGLGIPFFSGFTPENIKDFKDRSKIDLIINSAAYDPKTHPELLLAAELGIPIMEYTEALGELSDGIPSGAVSGVHGKTTTTALAGSLVKALGLQGTVLAGSGVAGFGNRSTLIQGNEFFLAETCEYRRHFLRFHPDHIILTSIEPDHLDYFKGYDDIFSAFMEFIALLPKGGSLIYCADEEGASEAARKTEHMRPDVFLIPYGINCDGPFRIVNTKLLPGENRFSLAGWEAEFSLRVPGKHTVLNAAAALALVSRLAGFSEGIPDRIQVEALKQGIASFAGSRRRSEILGESRGILFMDDYAHHPSAIITTLKGLKEFYPDRRLVVDFMSHTYSRTAGLFKEFCRAFKDADVLILHKIYGSAREKEGAAGSKVSGMSLFEGVREDWMRHGKRPGEKDICYFHEIEESREFLSALLQPGDLFLTMGAGNNWTMGRDLYNQNLGEKY